MIVEPADLRDYMSEITLSDSQLEAAAQVLAGVQGELELFLNRSVEQKEMTERAAVYPDGRIEVSNTPIVRILSVTPAEPQYVPEDLPPGQVVPVPVVNPVTGLVPVNTVPYEVQGALYGPASYGIYATYVTITYVGGYDGKNDEAMKLGILEVASRYMTNNHDDTRSISGDTVDSGPATAGPKYWTQPELDMFDRRRRRTVV